MTPTSALESRVRALESSLRRTRSAALGLGLLLTILAGAALVPQSTDATTRMLLSRPDDQAAPAPQVPNQVANQVNAGRLVLTDAAGAPAVVIVAGPESSVVIQTPTGQEVLRLGGPPGRHIVH